MDNNTSIKAGLGREGKKYTYTHMKGYESEEKMFENESINNDLRWSNKTDLSH